MLVDFFLSRRATYVEKRQGLSYAKGCFAAKISLFSDLTNIHYVKNVVFTLIRRQMTE